MANSIAASRRLFRETQPVKNERWLRQLDEICEAFGARVAVKLRTSRRILAPVVVGVLWPAIVLPLGLLTGVPRDMLRAALAHEAAHIARWDPLINLLQMGVEALLFFNPFVWLLNQAARQEREACCDAMASRWCGDPASYSEALVWWTRHSYGVTLGATAAMNGNDKRLLDRVARLLHPARIPHVLTGWPAGAGWAFLVGLFFLSTAYGVRFTVSQLSPSERVARIDRIMEPFRREVEPVAPPSTQKRSFSGVIVDGAGAPVAGAEWTIFSEMPNRYRGATRDGGVTGDDGKFAGSIPQGLLRLRVRSERFATSWATYPLAQAAENVRVVMSPGIDFPILCVDPEGAPIAGVRVGIGYEQSDGDTAVATTGDDGIARLEHQFEGKLATVQFDAPGYQDTNATAVLVNAKGKPLQMTLKKAAPYVLTVVDEVDGTQLPNVEVSITDISPSPSTGTAWPRWSNAGLKTNGKGMVSLQGLNPACRYAMKAKLPWRGALFQIAPGENSASTLRLPRERRVRLKVTNLEDIADQEIRIGVSQRVTDGNQDTGSLTAPIVDGTVEAELRGLRPGPVRFHILEQWTNGPNLKDEVTDFTIEFPKFIRPPNHKVVIICDAGRKGAAPMGSLWVNWALPEQMTYGWKGVAAPITNGRAEFELPATALFTLGNGLLSGGKLDDSKKYQVGPNPTVITVPVKPAGMIRVKVLEKDGRLATRMTVGGRGVSNRQDRLDIQDGAATEFPLEWYPSRAIELGADKYVIRAQAGNRIALSAPIRVDEYSPVKDVVLTLPEPMTREVLVVDEGGTPVPNVHLQAFLEVEGDGYTGALAQTDSSGLAAVIVGNGGVPAKISLRAAEANFVPVEVPIDFSRASRPRMVLPAGHRVAGRVIDRGSGAGVAGVDIFWMIDANLFSPYHQTTDSTGRFEFTNCPSQKVFLSTRPPPEKVVAKGQSLYAVPDREEVVIYTEDQPVK